MVLGLLEVDMVRLLGIDSLCDDEAVSECVSLIESVSSGVMEADRVVTFLD